MLWWRRRARGTRKPDRIGPDHSWPHGRHRHIDGDTVPFADGRRWVDYLRTEELPIVPPVDRPLMTLGAQHRAPDTRRSA